MMDMPLRRSLTIACLGLATLLPGYSWSQARSAPWTVAVTQTMDPLPIGYCVAVHLAVLDASGRDRPRNPLGFYVTMADFDMAVTTQDGYSVAGHQIDASHWSVCGCQGAAIGAQATVTATYPSKALAAKTRQTGGELRATTSFTVGPPKNTVQPAACALAGAALNRQSPDGLAAAQPPAVSPGPPARPANDPFASAVAAVQQPGPTPTAPTPATPLTGSTPAAIPPATLLPVTAPDAAPLLPVNPSAFTAVQSGPGQVRLSWQPVAAASYYALFGPGLPQGGVKISGGATTYVANFVPSGPQEWAVASFYEPGPVSTAASAFPRSTLTVTAPVSTTAAAAPPAPPAPTPPVSAPAPSGKYRVTVTGLRAYQASQDDLLSRDGKGDEVFAAAYVRRYTRQIGSNSGSTTTANTTTTANGVTQLQGGQNLLQNAGGGGGGGNDVEVSNATANSTPTDSQLRETLVRRTLPYGDVFHFGANRIQAGTKSLSGGIHDGDMIPTGPLIAMRNTPAQAAIFPWKVWEGTLTNDADVLVISPSIWEKDGWAQTGGDVFYDQWVQNQQQLNVSLFANQTIQDQISQKSFGAITVGLSGNDAGTSGAAILRVIGEVGMMLGGAGLPVLTLLSNSADRPIGLVGVDFDRTGLPNQAVVLTREIIEAALVRPPLGSIPSPVPTHPIAMARIGVAAPVAGVIAVQFQDRSVTGAYFFPERPAIYQMFVQVERVP